MKDEDITIATVYKMLLSMSERIERNQQIIITKLDDLIHENGEQHALELQSLQRKVQSQSHQMREMELDHYFSTHPVHPLTDDSVAANT